MVNEYIDTKELLSQQYISVTCGTIYSDLFESDFFFSSLDHSVAVAINIHKGNFEINGTYRFDVSRKKEIRANFYSRKGIKVYLTTNPMLLGTVNTLLLISSNNNGSSDLIVSDFTTSRQKAIAKGVSKKVISFDNSDFNMESVKQAESRILEMVKCIKGELPLFGLVERLDNCISLLDAQKHEKLETKAKTLRLN